jgi:AraC-like DNA-binding protein
VDRNWLEREVRKEFVELFWGVRGALRFRHQDREWALKANEVCFFLPGDVHCISLLSESAEYYWMTFDGPYLDFLISAFGLERESRPAGNCPAELFLQLERELRDLSTNGEYRAGATCYEILSLSRFSGSSAEDQTVEQIKTMVEENFQDPAFDIRALAQKTGHHRSTLNRLVRRHFGMPPSEYLIGFRLQEAMKLLRDTTYSIKEIAESAGFSDQNYFAKVINRRFGKTPSQFRKHG